MSLEEDRNESIPEIAEEALPTLQRPRDFLDSLSSSKVSRRFIDLLARVPSYSSIDEEDESLNENQNLLQIKLIEKNHSLLKSLDEFYASRYGAVGVSLEKTLNLAASSESALRGTASLVVETTKTQKEVYRKINESLRIASEISFPDF